MTELFPEFHPEREKEKLKAKFNGMEFKGNYDYYADDAEAVVFLINKSGINPVNCLYVMKRVDAIKFCSRKETSKQEGFMSWSYMFTTYKTNWREDLDSFREDDGRFEKLFEELGINLIYAKSCTKFYRGQYENIHLQKLP
ncbi:MAG: hypothetical protein LBC87_07235 [Fibromonadaceae bacterium]|jgi:hypothetical protein|nr:hypothetical protein [Fibromonadaceae bacterium]